MRTTPMTALASVAVLLTAGCGAAEVREPDDEGAASGPLSIAVVPKAVGFDFWDSVREGAECAASEQDDVDVDWDGVTAETDVTGQVDLLQNFLTRQVDGLVYAATDAQVLSQVSENALSQGIPVVNIDSGTTPQPDEIPVFATDNVAAAEEAANLLADALGEGDHQIAFIPFQPGTLTNDQRDEGFKAGLENHPNLELVAEQSSQSDTNTALQVTQDILSSNPDLDGIFAANEPGVIGAAAAIEEAGLAGEVQVIGWDASPDQIAGVESGTISALVVQNPFRMGYDSVNAMVEILREDAEVESQDTGVTFVTADNLDDPEVQAVLEPSCEEPPV